MKRKIRNSENGIAMIVVLFALILVAAIGLALMFATNGETGINSGFRQSNLSYFAARAGVEEARDRMRKTSAQDANGINDFLPTVPLGQTGGVLYVTNPLGSETVSPWDYTNAYFDDELCHEIASGQGVSNAPGSPDIPCPKAAASLPTAANWYTQKSSESLPGSLTLSYKWTRVNLKLNESASPWCVLGIGTCTHLSGNPSSDQVCYNGQNEFVLADVQTPIDVPGQLKGTSLPEQLAMALFTFGGSSGNGNSSGGSATAGFTTTGSSSSSTSGTNGNGTNANSGHGSSSSSSSSTTGSSSTSGSSTSGSSTSGSSTSGSSTSSSSGSTTGLTTGTTTGLTTGTTTGLTTGTTTGLTTGTTTGLTTGSSSTTGSSTTGSSSSSGSSSTGGSSSGSSSSTGSTGSSNACGTSAPPLPGNPIGIGGSAVTANACVDVDSQNVYVLTTLALAPTSSSVNKARRMIQYEVAKLAVPPVPAALTLIGPTPTASMPNSSPFNVIGTDGGTMQNSTTCNPGPGTGKPAIVTATYQGSSTETATQLATDARNILINAIPSNRVGNYTGIDNCGTTEPDVQNGQNVTNSLLDSPQGLQNIVQNVENSATQTAASNPTYNPTSCAGISNCISSLGTDANPKVTVVDGDLTLSGLVRGAGILLVTGTLTYSGNFGFDGLVIAVGDGHIIANGGGAGQFNGAVIIAHIGDDSGCPNSPCYKTNPSQANLLLDSHGQPTLGSPTLDWSGGGGNGIQYDSCAIALAGNAPAYTVIARREITY